MSFEIDKLFLALADKTRLGIINLLREGEVSVGDFAEILGESQPKISRHLAYLRNVEIVVTRREGKMIYYKLAESKNSFAAKIMRDTLDWLAAHEKFQEDYAQLCAVSSAVVNLPVKESDSSSQISAQPNINISGRQELAVFLL